MSAIILKGITQEILMFKRTKATKAYHLYMD